MTMSSGNMHEVFSLPWKIIPLANLVVDCFDLDNLSYSPPKSLSLCTSDPKALDDVLMVLITRLTIEFCALLGRGLEARGYGQP